MYIKWEEDSYNSEYKINYIKTKFAKDAFDTMNIILLKNGYIKNNYDDKLINLYPIYDWYIHEN